LVLADAFKITGVGHNHTILFKLTKEIGHKGECWVLCLEMALAATLTFGTGSGSASLV
jgi:hypothetical protein